MPIIARIYEPGLYGSYALLMAIATLVCFVGTFRLDLGIIAAPNSEEASRLATLVLIGAIISALLWLLLPRLVVPLERISPTLQPGGSGVALTLVLLLSCQVVTLAMLVQSQQTLAVALINLAFQSVFFVCALVLAPRGWLGNGLVDSRLIGLVLAVSAGAVLVALPAVVVSGIGGWRHWGALLVARSGYAVFTFPYTVLGMLAADSLLYVFAFLGDVASAGQVALVRALLLAPGSILAGAVSAMFFRSILDASTPEDTHRRTHHAALALARVAMPAFGLVAALAPQLLGTFFGSAWRESAAVMQLLALPFAMTILTGWPERAFEAKNRQRLAFFLQAAATAATYLGLAATAWFLDVRGLGLIGVFAAVHLAYQVWYGAMAFRLLGLSWPEIVRCFGEAVLLFIAGGAAGTLILWGVSGDFAAIAIAGVLICMIGAAQARGLLRAISDLGR